MNSARHLLVERNINCADQADHEQADLAEPFPQSQSDISELHRHNFPGKRHPEWRPPDQWTAANRVVQCVRVIDQPRISRKLSEADNDSKANEKTIIDNVERCARTPVRPCL